MKFCPQCGTPFEPNARFCQECAFDRASVEPIQAPVEAAAKVTLPPPPCPRCNKQLVAGERFCEECGFDIEAYQPKAHQPEEAPKVIAFDKVPVGETPGKQETVKPSAKTFFCLQCGGSALTENDRYCPICGFDTMLDKAEIAKEPEPVKPKVDTPRPPAPEPVVQKPMVEPKPIAPPIAPRPVEPPPTPKPVNKPLPSYSPPRELPLYDAPQTKKDPLLKIVLMVVAACIVVALGWYAYSKFVKTTPTPPATPTEQAPATPNATSPAPPTTPEQPKTTAKPKSRLDEALEKYGSKKPAKPTQPAKPKAD